MLCLKEDTFERVWKKYTADAMGALLNGLSDDQAKKIPLFTELFKPGAKPMTAEEIINGVLEKLDE